MNASAPSPSPPTRHAPLALWRVAEAFMHTLYTLFGAPEDVALDHTYTTKPYRLLRSWLACAEAMLRRLLLIEAAAFPKPNTRPLLWEKRPRVRRHRAFTHDKPEEWRVSFRCFVSPTLRRAQRDAECGAAGPVSVGLSLSKAKRPAPKRFHPAWPLAERYEAILRVFNNPEPYARRLAARLHAQAHRLREILRAPPEARHRVDRWEALTHAADVRWPRVADTS